MVSGSPNLLPKQLLMLSVFFAGYAVSAGVAVGAEKYIFGWLERIAVQDGTVLLDAKLDTGATTSSIDARNIYRFRRGKKRFVRFELPIAQSGDARLIERPLVRMVRIKQHDGQYQRRPVVTLDICIGRVQRRVEFSLVDRRNFDQPVLLGRNALAGSALVDSDLERTAQPRCDQASSDP